MNLLRYRNNLIDSRKNKVELSGKRFVVKNLLRHASSFIAPVVMCLGLPGLIIWVESKIPSYPVILPSLNSFFAGAVLIWVGLYFLIKTIILFIKIGKGTIMPWDPTQELIISGPYTLVRNPMILGLIIILLGEAVLLGSIGVGALALLNFVGNTIYFKYSEEPGLLKRFGNKYDEYKKNVPRWIPRLKPWNPVQ